MMLVPGTGHPSKVELNVFVHRRHSTQNGPFGPGARYLSVLRKNVPVPEADRSLPEYFLYSPLPDQEGRSFSCLR